jgi:hypothetical protein
MGRSAILLCCRLRRLRKRSAYFGSNGAAGAALALALRRRYLEVTQRKRVPLAMLDRELRAAAKAENMPLLGAD